MIHTLQRTLRRLPLRWRLALSSFGLLALLLTTLGTWLSITEEQTLLRSQSAALQHDADFALFALESISSTTSLRQSDALPISANSKANRVIPDLLAGLAGKASSIVSKLSNGSERIAVLTLNGRPLPHSDLLPISITPATISTLLTSNPPYTLEADQNGQRYLLVQLPIQADKQGVAALLEMTMPTTFIDETIVSLRLTLLCGMFGVLLAAAALTLPLINVSLRPLVEIERTSKRIAAGALDLRLEEPETRDEIGRLAQSFNEMVARLEAVFQGQKRFVADVSHELRTPLTALGGSLEMLLLGADGGDPQRERRLLRGMYAEVERMRRLVLDLLSLARLDEGQLPLHREKVDLTLLLREIEEQACQLATGQKISCQLAPELPDVEGDPDHLRRVLLNLVENALKFTPADGSIELLASGDPAGGVTLRVRDSGSGIAPESLPHVFERFYRVDQARTRAGAGGSGLGLAISRGLIELHGGTLQLESSPGVGTTAILSLPAQPAPIAASLVAQKCL